MSIIDDFREMLARLPETGENGFEGLIAVACSQVSGVTFRLVKSGRQFGRDTEATASGAAILFEAKRYTSRLSFAALASKLFEAIDRSGRPVEVWGAAATVPLDAMDAEGLKEAGEKRGVTVVLLDWTEPLPRLAILLSAAASAVLDWFGRHAPEQAEAAAQALDHVRAHSFYDSGLLGIQAELLPGTVGLAMARRRNADWMAVRFDDRRAALRDFNQPLAPCDLSLRPRPIARVVLEASVREAVDRWPGVAQAVVLTGIPQEQAPKGLQGDEGVGKSWAVVRSWLTMMHDESDPRPILLFMASHMWRDGDEERPIELLARLCMLQCGSGFETQGDIERWKLRLIRWLERPVQPGGRPLILVVLDGVNERARRWSTLITSLAGLSRNWPIRIVVTCRRGAFDRDLSPQLRGIDVLPVPVEAFSDRDLDAALVREGRDPSTVQEPLRTFLRNPRVLSVGITLLDRLDPEEVGVERLLFEYLVKRQEERAGRSSLTPVQLVQTLVKHAREVHERLLAKKTERESKQFDHEGARKRIAAPWGELIDDLGDIVESQFLRTIDPRRNRYAFTTQAWPLGLALFVVDELDQAVEDGRGADLPALLDATLDPIAAIDATSGVLLAALEVSLADVAIADAVAEELLVALLILQNVPDQNRARIFAGLRERPAIYIAATDRLFRRWHGIARREWMIDALVARRFDDNVRPTLDPAIGRWLRSWQPRPIEPDLDGYPAEQAATAKREHEGRVREHERALTSLLEGERAYVDRELVSLSEGREVGVDEIAVRLLGGRELLPFANDLFAWCVARSIGWGRGAYSEMRWLRRLTPIDWEETTQAIGRLADEASCEGRSRAFDWACEFALNFSGDPAQAALSDALWASIHDGPRRIVSRAWGDACEVDPLDYDAPAPAGDLSEVRQRYSQWCSQASRSPVLMRRADTAMSRARQILCRFAPEFAADCHRRLARQASDITGAAPAVIASFVAADTVILEEAESTALLSWLRRLLADGPLQEPNRETAPLLLTAILPRLDAQQQFDVVTGMLTDVHHPFWLESFMHPLPDCTLEGRLAEAAARGSAAFRHALIFAGANTVQPEVVRSAVSNALSSDEPLIRGLGLRTLIRLDAKEDIARFASSDWRWSRSVAVERIGENFCGSLCLVKALGCRDDPMLLERLHPVHWSRAVLDGGAAVACAVGKALVAALTKVDASMRPPNGIAVACTRSDEGVAPVSELAGVDITISYPVGRMIEDPDGSRRRPLGMPDYIAYEQAVIDSGCALMLYPLTSAALDRIAAAAPEVFAQAFSFVETIPEGDSFEASVVVAHDLARALSHSDSERAARLFSRFEKATPIIAEVMPYSRVPRETFLLWQAANSPEIERVRHRRLDRAVSDDVLAAHAVAAAMAGRRDRMKAYVLERAEDRHPAAMAKALTLAGFSVVDDAFDKLFSDARFAHGFLGDVRAFAHEAYRRAASAARWYRSALAAESALDVWRFCELAAAAADARCTLWMEEGVGSVWFERARPLLRNALAYSVASAERDRKGTLFGERAPPEALTISLSC